jgi:adenylylsulfate kinase-like enzyme
MSSSAPSEPCRTIWIIGPACVGKSTLARLLTERLRRAGRPAMLLDGDEVRSLFDNQLGYDPTSRRKQTQRMQRLARWILRQEILPVVAIIHPFEDDRLRCRGELPGYFEVHLVCDMKERIRRDTKKLYLPALKGERRHVVDVDIPFEPPGASDLTIDTAAVSPEAALETLWAAIEPRIACSPTGSPAARSGR